MFGGETCIVADVPPMPCCIIETPTVIVMISPFANVSVVELDEPFPMLSLLISFDFIPFEELLLSKDPIVAAETTKRSEASTDSSGAILSMIDKDVMMKKNMYSYER